MMDPYLVVTLRMKELQRESELARWAPEPSVSRLRTALAQWLIRAAERLSPEAGRTVTGGAR